MSRLAVNLVPVAARRQSAALWTNASRMRRSADAPLQSSPIQSRDKAYDVTGIGRRVVAAFLLVFFSLAAWPVLAQSNQLERAPLHVGFTRSSFRNVNPSDAEAAFQVFTKTVGRQLGYDLDTSTRLFDSAATCETEVKKGSLTLVIVDAMEYLNMDIPDMEPAFVHYEQGVVLKEYLLLTRRGSGLNTLADLRGKDIVVLSSKSGAVSMNWLEVLLLEQGLPAKDTFFHKVEVVTKPSTAVLPVFFGSKPACVVDRLSYQIMVELNPQVDSILLPIVVSEPYLDSITCVTRSGFKTERARTDLWQSLLDLHLNPAGRQILTLFKVDQLVPFKEEYMKSVRDLRTKLASIKRIANQSKVGLHRWPARRPRPNR